MRTVKQKVILISLNVYFINKYVRVNYDKYSKIYLLGKSDEIGDVYTLANNVR